jgi:hypothetical protein
MDTGLEQGVFTKSGRLLVANPIIIVPGLVIGAAAAILDAVLEPKPDSLGGSFPLVVLLGVIKVLSTILAVAYTTGMADAAWRTAKATIADGSSAFRRDAGHVFVAMIVLFAAGIIAALLAPLTAGCSFIVLIYFLIYTMPAAVVGDRPGLLAVRESIEIAIARPATTILVVAAITIIAVGMSVLAEALAGAPFIGPLVAAVVLQAAVVYLTLVIVGEYRALKRPREQ